MSTRLAIPDVSTRILWLGLAAVWLLAQLRTVTYVTSEDPATYIRWSRAILNAPDSFADRAKAVFMHIAPGYPLLLAFAIRTFGLFAPYWTNLVFAILLIPVLWFLLRELLEDEQAASLGLVGAMWVIVAGYALNVPFLLYPFRDLPALFFMLVGMLLFVRATSKSKPNPIIMLSSSLSFLLAFSIREPAALGMAAPWLAHAISRQSRGKKLRDAAWFAAPWLLAVACWLALASHINQTMNNQMIGWLNATFGEGLKAMFQRFWRSFYEMLFLIPDEFGTPGFVLFLLSLFAIRRCWKFGLYFGLSAVLFMVFYSLLEAHRRYFINSLILLGPFLGVGVFTLVFGAQRVLAGRIPHRSLAWLHPVCAFFWVAMLGIKTNQLQPWRPRVTREEVRQLRAVVEQQGDTNYWTVEDRNRDMAAALYSHTAVYLSDPAYMSASRPRVLFFKPLSPPCFTSAPAPNRGVRNEKQLRHLGDLIPALTPVGESIFIKLGAGQYQLMQLRPYTNRTFQCPLEIQDPQAQLVWLDFRKTPAENKKTIVWRAADGHKIQTWEIRGGGLQALYLPARPEPAMTGLLEVSSDGPLPTSIFAGLFPARAAFFSLGEDRRLSTEEWFEPPFISSGGRRYGVFLHQRGRLRIPFPHGTGYSGLVLGVELGRRNSSWKSLQVRISRPDGVTLKALTDLEFLNGKPFFRVPRRAGEDEALLDIQIATKIPFPVLWLCVGVY